MSYYIEKNKYEFFPKILYITTFQIGQKNKHERGYYKVNRKKMQNNIFVPLRWGKFSYKTPKGTHQGKYTICV